MRPLKIALLSLAFLGLASLGARPARAGMLDGTYRGTPGGATYALHERIPEIKLPENIEYYEFTYRGFILQGEGIVLLDTDTGEIGVKVTSGTLAGRTFEGSWVSFTHFEIYKVPPRPGWPPVTLHLHRQK